MHGPNTAGRVTISRRVSPRVQFAFYSMPVWARRAWYLQTTSDLYIDDSFKCLWVLLLLVRDENLLIQST